MQVEIKITVPKYIFKYQMGLEKEVGVGERVEHGCKEKH